MSYVRICDTCNNTRVELDADDPTSTELPEGWTTDEFERDHCAFCNLCEATFQAGEATPEDLQPFVKELKKETKKLKKSKKEVPNVE